MKTVVRNIAIYMYILFVLPKIIPGVQVEGGFLTFLMGGVALALMFLVIKPILNIISLPVNVLTMGLFSTVTNALILYLLAIFVTNFSILAFTYPKMEFNGFIIPSLAFNTFFAYLYTAVVLSCINACLQWLRK
jgi:putative membrane protein